MNRSCLFIIIIPFIANFSLQICIAQKGNPKAEMEITEWPMARISDMMPALIKIKGNPGVTDCKYGKALMFNGSADGVFIDAMPLVGKEQFTVEIIFQPESGGNFEQRFLHFGEVQGNRLLLELRSVKTDWYLDAFIKSEVNQCTLIDSQKLHPSDKWYHIACVLDKKKFTTFINGKKEGEGSLDFITFKTGKTSVGVRQNITSWFKGSIYMIRVTAKALIPEEFMKY